MAYTSNVPQGAQQVSQTQSLIQANFQSLSSFGNGYAEMSLQSSAPAFATTSDGLYTLAYATTGTNELYVHRQAATAGLAEVPFTASKMSNTAAASCFSGWTYLPSGLLMKWGQYQITSNGSTSVNVTATSGGPAFTQNFIILVTPIQDTGTTPAFVVNLATKTNLVANAFSVVCSGATASDTYINYIVLGV